MDNIKCARNRVQTVRMRGVGLTVLTLLACVVSGPAALADWSANTGNELPTALHRSSAVAVGDVIYILGGFDGNFRHQILRYDPLTGSVDTMSATLPGGRWGTSAVWDGDRIYLFGGGDPTSGTQIIAYDPAADEVTLLPQTLPTSRGGTSAIWDGSAAYIFGGYENSAGAPPIDEVIRFEPLTGAVEVIQSPYALTSASSAAWNGQFAYIFGGWRGTRESISNSVIRFDPEIRQFGLAAPLPAPVMMTSAIADGSNAFIFGGIGLGPILSAIVQYNMTVGTNQVMASGLPGGRFGTTAAWTNDTAYIFGGMDGEYSYPEEIVRYIPKPSPPRGLSAHTPPIGSTDLSWLPPEFAGPNPVYHVQRSIRGSDFVSITTTQQTHARDDHCHVLHECAYRVVATDAGGSSRPAEVSEQGGAVWILGHCVSCP